MTEKVIIAGAGGQGVMLLGKILAEAAMLEDKFVTWMPSYGAEVRGGTAHCMLVISDEEIGSPCVGLADTLIMMNALSLSRFKKRLKDGGLLVLNGSLAKKNGEEKCFDVFDYKFTDIAVELGNIKVANMLALGSYLAKKKTVDLKTVFEVIKNNAPSGRQDLIEINKKALERGVSLK